MWFICRWLKQPSSVACMQHAVYYSACDKHEFRSFRNLVVICSSQQSHAIPKRFSATSFIDVRWYSCLNSGATRSRHTIACSQMDGSHECRNSIPNTVPMLRLLHTSPVGQREPESKVEETLEALKDSVKKAAATEPGDTVVTEAKMPPKVTEVEDLPPAVPEVVTAEKKKSLWVRFKAEMVHYYHGFRLLFIDIRVALRLIWHVLNGQSLMRRERKQVSFLFA